MITRIACRSRGLAMALVECIQADDCDATWLVTDDGVDVITTASADVVQTAHDYIELGVGL